MARFDRMFSYCSSDKPPNQHNHRGAQQYPVEVMAKELAHHVDCAGAEIDDYDCEHGKAHKTSKKDCQLKMADAHFGDGRSECECFEWSWRWKHCREHQTPERVFFEGIVHPGKTLRRDALPQKLFTTGESNGIDDEAADRRTG